MLARGSSPWWIALAALAWAPSLAFAALGAWSVARAGGLGLARGGLAGSIAWWSLVVVVAAATATRARALPKAPPF